MAPVRKKHIMYRLDEVPADFDWSRKSGSMLRISLKKIQEEMICINGHSELKNIDSRGRLLDECSK